MPTYRYDCASCGKLHEIFHSISDAPRRKCPDCGGKLTRRIGTGGGVLLKGDGFYTTENRSESYRQAAKKDSESSTPASDKKPAKPDSKKPSPKKGKKKE